MDCFFTLKNRIRHCFLAKDEYSLHSPFMFDLFTKGLKTKSKHLPAKGHKARFICRLANYFQPKEVLIFGDKDKKYANCLSKTLSQSHHIHIPKVGNNDWEKQIQKVDFVLLDFKGQKQETKNCFEALFASYSPESVIILMNTDCDRAAKFLFEEMKRDERLKICADFGFCGVVFQTPKPLIKQNYILRTR